MLKQPCLNVRASSKHLMLKGLFVAACGALVLHFASATTGTFPNKLQWAVPRKTRTLALYEKLMCRKIPAEITRGLTGAVPLLQIHREVELNDWTWQLGRTTLCLFNLPCRIKQPRQGQETAYCTNTTLQGFFFFLVCCQVHFWH